jgi:capsular exopolysaccharide synthesis family protein
VLQRLKEAELSAELQSNNARILDVADVPTSPIWPRTQLNLIVGLLGGAFVAVALVIGLEYLNPRIARPDDVGDTLGLPLLGVAPKVAGLKHGHLITDRLPLPFQEALRSIRTRILLSPIGVDTQTLAITSTSSGEGKTVVASGLAISMAMAGRRVLLVDADMRRPQVHRFFNMSASPGLSNVMSGGAKPSEALHQSNVKGLFILPAGADVAKPSDLLDSERLSALIRGFSEVFDVVLLDCPPVMAIADASIIANAAASVLFVVGAGVTSREAAQAAIERLTSVQGQVIGVVLNQAKPDHSTEYGNPYYQTEGTA